MRAIRSKRPTCETIPGTDLPRVVLKTVGHEDIDTVHEWLSNQRVHCWLDFGGGRQQLSRLAVGSMLTSKRNRGLLFYAPDSTVPIGIVCLTDIDNAMGSAEIWGVRGHFGPAPKNITTSALLAAMATGFLEHGREAIGTWLVDGNVASVGVHAKLGMTQTGRQRGRHRMGAELRDRILFDMLRHEFIARFPDAPAASGVTCRSLGWVDSAAACPRAEAE